jgi:ubiquinone/menaquinone biosynthesis C-methylase UbiE
MEAKANLENAGQKGIYICGDITNIPVNDNACDVVLCQHTLYHIPRKEQSTAINEIVQSSKNRL